MRIDNPAALLKTAGDSLKPVTSSADGDFLSRVNTTINNFKELAKVVKQFRDNSEGESEPVNPMPQTKAPGLADYIQLAIENGHGDTKIEQIIKQVNPLTLKQIIGVLKNVGPK